MIRFDGYYDVLYSDLRIFHIYFLQLFCINKNICKEKIIISFKYWNVPYIYIYLEYCTVKARQTDNVEPS